jgi:hypothetical protein
MNEYQMVYEKAKREAGLKDESFKARTMLVGDVQAVLMLSVTRYCPYTDAILGADTTIEEVFTDVDKAEAALAKKYENEEEFDDNLYYFLIRREMPEAVKSYNQVNDDDIPF